MHQLRLSFSLLLLLALVVGSAAAQERKTVNRTLPLGDGGEVAIDTYKGSITVTTWDRNEVEIEAVIEADEDEDLVALTEVKISGSDSRVRIETDYDKVNNMRRRNTSLPFAHYIIRMPRTAELDIDDYKSEIRVAGVGADLDLETYKGEVEVKDVNGDIDLETYKGNVVITGLAGSLRVDTYKGDVRATFDAFSARSAIDTYKGSVEFILPQAAGFDLDADLGRRGDLDASFDLASLRNSDDDDDEQRYRGSVNGGGPRLDVETYKGTIRLVSR